MTCKGVEEEGDIATDVAEMMYASKVGIGSVVGLFPQALVSRPKGEAGIRFDAYVDEAVIL